MRSICFVKDDMSVMGGREKILATLANALSDTYDVHVVCIWNERSSPPYFPLRKSVHVHQIIDRNVRIREAMSKGIPLLRRYLRDNQIDVALSIGTNTHFILLAAAVGTKAKTICCEHSNLKNQYYGWFGRFNQRVAAWWADKIVTLTKQDMEEHIRKFHLKPSRLDYNYNCIDNALLERRPQYDSSSTKILSVGRFDAVKAYPLLVDVAARVLPKHPNWQWHIYGDGEEMEVVRKKIEALHLTGQVILKGAVKTMDKFYPQYAIMTLTSYHEGLPMVLLEAKANSLPIVSFDCATGPREIVRDGVDGYLVPVGDVEGMAERIERLVGDEELRRSFSENSLQNIDPFSQEVVIEKWKDILESV